MLKNLRFKKEQLEKQLTVLQDERSSISKGLEEMRTIENPNKDDIQKKIDRVNAIDNELRSLEGQLSLTDDLIKNYKEEKPEVVVERSKENMDNLLKRFRAGEIDKGSITLEQRNEIERQGFIEGLRTITTRSFESIVGEYNELRAGLAFDGTGGAGGSMVVPTAIYNKIIAKIVQDSVFFKRVNVTNIPGNLELVIDDGDIVVNWEGDSPATPAAARQGATLDKKTLKPKLATVRIEISKLLLAISSFDLEGYLVNKVSKAFRNDVDAQILTGDGVKKPLGIITDLIARGEGDVEVETEISNTALIDFLRSMDDSYQVEVYLSTTTLGMIDKLLDTNKKPLYQATIYGDTFNGVLLNRKAVVSNKVPTGYIIMGDLMAGYAVNVSLDMAITPYDKAMVGEYKKGFMVAMALDGAVADKNALKVIKLVNPA